MPDKKQVLIIEDDRFLSSIMKARLDKDGFSAVQAFNGEEAVNFLKQNKPNLVVLDLIMPRVSGFEVLQYISLDPNLNQIPVIILSNLAQESDIKKARELGAVDYFVKIKVSIDDLIKRIEDILGR